MWALFPRGNSWPRNGTQGGKGAEVTPKCSKVLILGTSSTQDVLRVTRAIFLPQQPHPLPTPSPSSGKGKRSVPKVRHVERLKQRRSSGDACSVPMATENDPNSRWEGCSWLARGRIQAWVRALALGSSSLWALERQKLRGESRVDQSPGIAIEEAPSTQTSLLLLFFSGPVGFFSGPVLL